MCRYARRTSLAVLFLAFSNLSWSKPYDLQLYEIFPGQTPTNLEWQTFHRFSEGQKRSFWQWMSDRKVKLQDWSWEWRLGWIRSCQASSHPSCSQILFTALFDKAALVRREAASTIGQRFSGTENSKVVQILMQAADNPKNFRNGKPLSVQQSLLLALRRVGGPLARGGAQQIARRHHTTETYWQRLSKSYKEAL